MGALLAGGGMPVSALADCALVSTATAALSDVAYSMALLPVENAYASAALGTTAMQRLLVVNAKPRIFRKGSLAKGKQAMALD